MIASEREYQITKEEAERFVQALAALETDQTDRSSEMQQLLRQALESQLEDLRRELLEYESALQARRFR